MTSLVTGGAGFIGSAVARALLKAGERRPIVFDIAAATDRLDDVIDQVDVIRGDLGNFSHVLDAVRLTRPDVIYHLGAMLSTPSEADPAAALRTNALGTFHVLEAARLFGVPQVLFASSIGTYGTGIRDDVIDDDTLQRPELFYGATKVFGEHMGLFYKRKFGLDFRGIRYVSVVGPGVRTHGVDHYTSWAIEQCAMSNPFSIWVKPKTRIPVIYIRDAARAMVELGKAPLANIKSVNYLVAGVKPIASAGELADLVRAKLPGAQIDFKPDLEVQALLDEMLRPVDDSKAREEWGWQIEFDQERIVEDFIQQIRADSKSYR